MSGVIREARFSSAPAFSFASIEQSAQQIIEAARREAAELLTQASEAGRRDAEAQRERILSDAREQGLREGREQAQREAAAAALAESRQRMAHLGTSLSAALADFDRCKRELIAAAEQGLVRLAVAVAERVCKLRCEQGSEATRAAVQHLLELVQVGDDLVLHVHPEEMESLHAALPELLKQAEALGHVELRADPQVGRGGCVLHARDLSIDATIETQLARLAEALCGAGGDA